MNQGDEASPSDGGGRGRFRFTLRGLALFVVIVSVGFAGARYDGFAARSFLWNVIGAWMIWGVGQQVLDLIRYANQANVASPNERWGLRSAIAWRTCAIVFLLPDFVVDASCIWFVRRMPETWVELVRMSSDDLSVFIARVNVGHVTEDFRILARITVLCSMMDTATLESKRRSVQMLVRAVAGGASLVLGLLCMFDATVVLHLVQIATLGIELAQSSGLYSQGIYEGAAMDIEERVFKFWRIASVVSVFAVVTPFLSFSLGKLSGRRGLLLTAYVVIIALNVGQIVCLRWAYATGLPQTLPAFGPVQGIVEPRRWIWCVPYLILFAVLASYQSCVKPGSLRWASRHNSETAYFHESRILVALSVFTVLIDWLATVSDVWGVLDQDWQDAFWFLLTWPTGQLYLATMIAAVTVLWQRWRRGGWPELTVPRLAPGRFACVWLAMLVSTAVAVATLSYFAMFVGYVFWLV